MLSKARLSSLALTGIGAAALATVLVSGQAPAAQPTVIDLTQVGCQFLESENGVDHGFTTTSKADCKSINAETAAKRLGRPCESYAGARTECNHGAYTTGGAHA